MNWKQLGRLLGLKIASEREASAAAFGDFDGEDASYWIDEDELPDPEFFSPKPRLVDLEWRQPLRLRADELPDPEWGNPWDAPTPLRLVLLRKHYPTTGAITSLLIPFSPLLAYVLTCQLGLITGCNKESVSTDLLLPFSAIFFVISFFSFMGLSSSDGIWDLESSSTSRTLARMLVRQSGNVLKHVLMYMAIFILGMYDSSANVCGKLYLPAILGVIYILSLVGQACRYWLLKGFTKAYSRKGENVILKALQNMSSTYDFIGYIFIILLITVFPLFVIYMLIFRS